MINKYLGSRSISLGMSLAFECFPIASLGIYHYPHPDLMELIARWYIGKASENPFP